MVAHRLRALLSLIAMIASIAPLLANAEGRIAIEVTPSRGGLDELFAMRVILEDVPEDAVPMLEGGDDFQLTLIGPERSVIIINGEVQETRALRYTLKPRKKGVLLSPSAVVEFDGRTLRANPVSVTVKDAVSVPAANDDSVFIEQEVFPREVYVGQQMLLHLNVYSAVPLFEMDIDEVAPDAMVQRRIEEDQRSSRMRQGKHYSVYTTKRLLYPLRAGALRIEPRTINGKVRTTRRRQNPPHGGGLFGSDFFDSFFGTVELSPVERRSNALEVTVKSLPPVPAEAPGWNHALPLVGATTVSIEDTARTLTTGTPVTIQARILSEGNLAAVDSLPWRLPPDFKFYETEVSTTLRLRGDRVLQQRTSTVTLVPLRPGEYRLDPVSLLYFDEIRGQYSIARSSSLSLSVSGPSLVSAAPASPEGQALSSDELPPQNVDPLSLYTEPSALEQLTTRLGSNALLFLGLAVLGFAVSVAAWLRTREHSAAWNAAWKRFEKAESAQQLTLACDELLHLKLGTSLASLFFGDTHPRGVPITQEQRFRLDGLRNDLSALQYGSEPLAFVELRERARTLIKEL